MSEAATLQAVNASRRASKRRRRRRTAALAAAALACCAGTAGLAAVWPHRDQVAFWFYRDPVATAAARIDAGDPAGAQALLRAALRENPRNAEAQLLMGRAAYALGDVIAAERALREAQALGAGPARILQPLAASVLAQDRPQEAVDLLAGAGTGADPSEQPRLLITRARALQQLGRAAEADAALNEARALSPFLIDASLAAADLALQRGDLGAAEREADRALLVDGRSAEALALKAQIIDQRGQRQAAIRLLSKAIAADPRAQAVRTERARLLLGAGRVGEARADVEALLREHPAEVTALYLKAAVLVHDGDYAAADALLQQLARSIPRLPRGWYAVAFVKLQLEQLEQAAQAADKFIAHAPDDLDGRKLQARIALAAQRPDAALAALDDALAAQVADSEMLDLASAAQAMAGHLAQAERTLTRASVLAPDNARIFARLGSVRLVSGDSPGAVAALERAFALAPDRAELAEQLVVAAAAGGETDRAAALLADLRGREGATAAVGRLDAVLALARFDAAAAARDLADVAAQHPEDLADRLRLAQTLLLLGRAADAEAALTALLAREPAHEEALAVLVPLLERTGRAARAILALETACRAAPANPALTLQLAALLDRAGRPDAALAAFDTAAMRRDASPRLLMARAAAESRAGQDAAARQTWEALRRAASGRPDVAIGYADFLTAHAASDEAARVLAASLAAAPGAPELQRAVVRQRLQAGGLEAALAAADALRQDPAAMPGAALLRGDLLQGAGRHADAAAAFRREFDAAPSAALATRLAAAIDAAQGPNAAALSLRPWVNAHPGDDAALTLLASYYSAANDMAAASAMLERLLARRPNDPIVMNNLAYAYAELGDARAYPLALRAYLATFDPVVADTLGCILLAAGRTQDALTLLRYADRELPAAAAIRLHLAQAARQAGLTDEARTLLVTLATRQFPGHATAVQLLATLDAH